MFDNRTIRENRLIIAIVSFLLLFSIVHYFKPALIYNENGGFRHFGIGYKQKTVVPIWIASIILAILCYLIAFYAGL